MPQRDLLKSLKSGEIPQKVKMLIAGGMAPIPPGQMLELLVHLLKDNDPEIAARASQTLAAWDEEEVSAKLKSRDCAPALLEYYAEAQCSNQIIQAIIASTSAPQGVIESLALKVPTKALESILENRIRILQYPHILENIRRNPSATPEILRIVQEIEFEFFGNKKSTYLIKTPDETEPSSPKLSEFKTEPASIQSETSQFELEPTPIQSETSQFELEPTPIQTETSQFELEPTPIQSETSQFELEPTPEDLTLEGLPIDEEERQAAIYKRLSSMPVSEKIRHALFGNREIRAVLVRDTNKEVSRSVLRSPKITGNEIEGIASMRSVADDVLREIGNSKQWTKSYAVVQNLVKNPKTPPIIAQRLLFRLRKQDLMYLTKDRSISEAVRHGAARLLKRRTTAGQSP